MFSSASSPRSKAVYLVIALIATFAVLLMAFRAGASDKPSAAKSDALRGQELAMKTGSQSLQAADIHKVDPLAHETYVPDQLVVRFESSATASDRSAARKAVDGSVEESLSLPGSQLIALPEGSDEKAAAAKLADVPGVKYAERNVVVRSTATPNDALYPQQWDLNNTGQTGGSADADIDAPEAWDRTTGNPNVVTAVVDTGVDYGLPDLTDNIYQSAGETGLDSQNRDKRSNGVDDDNNGYVDDWHGWNLLAGNDPMDDNFHGTHVAGTIAGRGNNGIGISGVTWNTKIMPVKVLNSSGIGYMTTAADGIDYAADNGARVVNLSLGGGYSQYLSDVIDAHPNTLIVAAAGNDANDNDNQTHFYPCNQPQSNVICVAATDNRDRLATFSNYGATTVDLAAPGVSILSTKATVSTRTGDYILLNGTSMAAPHVAGAAALLFSAESSATTADVRRALIDGTDVVGNLKNKVASDGRLNVNGALIRLDSILHRDPTKTTIEVTNSHDLRYHAAAGVTNDLDFTIVGNEVDVHDTAGVNILPTAPCYVINSNTARCPSANVRRLVINSYDGNDDINNATSFASLIDAGTGNDALHGGSGDDTFITDAGSDSYSGGGGIDTLDYSARTANVTATFDGTANDGTPGEADNVAADMENITGGSGNDTFTAASGAVTFVGGAGNDTLTGGNGNDTLDDGTGSDTLTASGGNDSLTVTVGDGADVVSGGSGTDTIYLRDTENQYVLASLDDIADDGLGDLDNYRADNENIVGGYGSEYLTGTSGANVLSGGPGSDTVNGGPGGADVLSGGDSQLDYVTYDTRTSGVSVSLDGVANDGSPGQGGNVATDFELIIGSPYNDTLTGGDGSGEIIWYNFITGEQTQGNEKIDGGLGADTISGGGGSVDWATYAGRSNPVTASIDGVANDGETGENDNIATDIRGIQGGYAGDTLTGGSGNDYLDGSFNNGQPGRDTLNGGGGDDTLYAGSPGTSDVFNGGSGTDIVDYLNTVSFSTLRFSDPVSFSLDGVNNDGFAGNSDTVGADIEGARGGAGTSTLTGNSSANNLFGGYAANTINGGGGNDYIVGGNSLQADQIDAGAGDDKIDGAPYGRGADYYWDRDSAGTGFNGGGDDQINGGDGDDTIQGGAVGNETIDGGNGNDVIDGSFGDDTFTGGAGTDLVRFSFNGEPLSLTLDGQANDGVTLNGATYEHANIGSDVENLTGGLSDDVIVGNGQSNKLDGNEGRDTITGGGGDDTLIGGLDPDNLDGGSGNDNLLAVDGSIDSLVCGADSDMYERDAGDTTNPDCESPASLPSISYGPSSGLYSEEVTYSSPEGVADNVNVSAASGVLTFQSTGHNLLARTGCVQVTATKVTCPQPSVATAALFVQLGDGNDQFRMDDTVSLISRIHDGPGNDIVRGGGGNDRLYSDGGADQISGGAGIRDWIRYDTRSNGVNVTFDGIANDGELGELDNIATDVEDVLGGRGNDVLIGSAANNHLFGEEGDDSLEGGLGADWLIGRQGTDQLTYAGRTSPVTIIPSDYAPEAYLFTADQLAHSSGAAGEGDWAGSDVEKLIGGSSNDTLRCSLGEGPISNVLVGGPGTDNYGGCDALKEETSDVISYEDHTTPVSVTLDGIANDGSAGENENINTNYEGYVGGSGNDTFTGNLYDNVFTGGAGDDLFQLADSSTDIANCGDGADTVNGDILDIAADDCETVNTPGGGTILSLFGNTLRFRTAGSAVNSLTITQSGGLVTVQDPVTPFSAGAGCTAVTATSATCAVPPDVTLDFATAGGNDQIFNNSPIALKADGGSGNDAIYGGTGDDTLDGGSGADSIGGGPGVDRASYATRTANVEVSLDGITNDGEANENDNLSADVENITTGSGNDLLVGDDDANALSGGSGYDTIVGRLGNDAIDGGTEEDWVSYSYEDAGVHVDISSPWSTNGAAGEADTITNIEDLQGGQGPDSLTGSDSRNTIWSAGGNDMISGNGGNDSIQAGDGIDSIWPGDGDDTVDGGDGGDSFNSSPGADTFIGGGGDQDQMFYSGETADLNVSLDGVANDGAAGEHDNVSADFDYLFGGSGNDTLVGSASGQMIGGMDGNDSVIGGLGADDLSGGQGNDTISYADRASGVNINSWYQQSGETGENDTIQPDFEHIIGGAGNDTIAAMYFNAASDFSVDGGAGNDSIQGNLNGGTLIGGAGSDYLNGYDAVDTMRTRDGEADQVNCGGGSDSVISDPVDTYPNGDCESIDNVVDTTPPPLTITSPSGGTTNAQYVTLQFTTEAGATTTCALNSGTPASCSYNDAIGPLVEGLNTVTVTAKDAAGNATTKTAQVTRDTIPPQTYLDSFSVNDPTATATFHASEAGAELQYSLDSGAWTTTNSPFTTPALSNGSHTLQVRAKDIVNNADQTPVSKTFNISVPGKLSLTSATSPTSVSLSTVGTLDWAHWGSAAATSWDHKSGVTSQISNVTLVGSGAALTRLSSISPSSSWTGGTPTASSTTSTAATGVSVGGASGRGFSFTVPGGNAGSRTLGLYVGAVNTTAKVELSLGDSSAAAITDTTSLVSTSSTAVNKLITISYRPVSSSSNLTVKVTTQSTGSVRLYAATLAANTDTTAPNTSITVPSTDGTVITTPTTSATITSTETGGTLQCKIDSGDYSTVASPYTTPSLQDGLHTLRCRAIDAAGNIDATPAVRTFWISTPTARLSAPAPTIQTAAVNLTTEGTLDWTHYGTSSASLTPNRKSGANVIGAVTQLGGGTLARLTSGVPGSTWTGGTPTSSATNSTTALSYNTTSPGVIGRGFQFSVPALPNQLRQLKLYVGVTNTTGKLEASLDDGSGLVATETSASNAAGTTNVAYTITFRASAASKNLTVKWTQNTTAATGRVSLQSATLVNNPDTTLPVTTITSGPADGSVVTTSTATFGFSSNESGSSFQCRMDETIYLPCANPFTTGTLSDGQHTFDVRAVDAAGNIASQPPRRTFTKQ